MEAQHTRALVEAAYAAGSRDRTGAAGQVLAVLKSATHFDASAVLSWDPVARTHRTMAAEGYALQTLDGLGDKYSSSAEHRAVRAARLAVRIDDMPGDYRSSETYRTVIGPAGFDDGMTECLYTADGGYVGMLHMSAADAGTFDNNARDLVSSLSLALARMCDCSEAVPSFVARIPDDAKAALIDCDGMTWPVANLATAHAISHPAFASLAKRFISSRQFVARGLWPSNAGWLSINLVRVPHPVDDRKSAALVQEQLRPLPFGLSPREVDVIQGVALGHANIRIASERSISPRTVTTHVEHILQKMGQESRAGAVGAAAREGLIRLDLAHMNEVPYGLRPAAPTS